MHEDTETRSILRSIVGKPRIWVASVWFACGMVWAVLMLVEGPSVERVVGALTFTVIGTVMGIVAINDRVHGQGHYAHR